MDHGERDTNPGDRRLASLIATIIKSRETVLSARALLVGISGIDGSGKGYVTAHLDGQLRTLGWNLATISADDWLNLPHVCVNRDRPAEHFYEYALRLEEMFKRLVGPLKQDRRVQLTADCGDAKATAHWKKHYNFSDVEIVLVEGIFLFKPAYRDYFDLKIWIDCSFETALNRAIARGQEGLPPAETKRDFETIYFPAQRIHLQRDDPRRNADIVFDNDHPAA